MDQILYKIGGNGLDVGMKELVDDISAKEMASVTKVFGYVDVYVVHKISEPEFVIMYYFLRA